MNVQQETALAAIRADFIRDTIDSAPQDSSFLFKQMAMVNAEDYAMKMITKENMQSYDVKNRLTNTGTATNGKK